MPDDLDVPADYAASIFRMDGLVLCLLRHRRIRLSSGRAKGSLPSTEPR
jgi:hypothetical protein